MKVDRDGELYDSPATPLPCPFCGADNLLDKSELGYGIDCMNCSATAIDVEAWNRRASPVAIAHEAVDHQFRFPGDYDDASINGDGWIRASAQYVAERAKQGYETRALAIATPTASDRPVVRAEDAKDAERWRMVQSIHEKHFGEDMTKRYTARLDQQIADRAAPPSAASSS